MWWWWIWLAFVFFFLLLPLGYGWGYRDWGPPYPTYIRRRRLPSGKILEERVYEDGPVAVREAEQSSGWGILADVLWLIFVAAIIWWIVAWWV